MRRKYETRRHETSWAAILLLTLLGGTAAWYIVFTQRGVELMYDEVDKMAAKTIQADQQKLELDDGETVYVPARRMFSPNFPWMYVSKSTPLPAVYQPARLTNLTVPGTEADGPLQVEPLLNAQLQAMFDKAKADDRHLMVSSAYRSVADQQKLYDEFVETKGEAMARQYVLTPGTSEHHTGYAVDITDASEGCRQDSNKCNLSYESTSWLAEHAPDYGFIIRYPSGKEPITGIAHEPWHLRYVGVNLARKLTASSMALDEFVAQAAPGRVK